jgi:regulator of protease activity HflC (stomatin/prohibitin superfamily)
LAPVLCLLGFVVIVVFMFLTTAIKIVPEYQRVVVFRLGRCVGEKGPGLVLLIPFVDRAIKVDLREQVREIPAQTSITKDNAPISIDFLWYYKVFDPTHTVLEVGNFELAAQGIATTTLRSVIGGIPLDGVLSEREAINNALRTRLDEVTERWGVKVTNVEIREILPPRDVQDAMNRQLSAERNRRAVVTESNGRREAEINIADGPPSSKPKAKNWPNCCAPKVTPAPWRKSSVLPTALIPRRSRCSILRPSRPCRRTHPPSTSSRWSSPAC